MWFTALNNNCSTAALQSTDYQHTTFDDIISMITYCYYVNQIMRMNL